MRVQHELVPWNIKYAGRALWPSPDQFVRILPVVVAAQSWGVNICRVKAIARRDNAGAEEVTSGATYAVRTPKMLRKVPQSDDLFVLIAKIRDAMNMMRTFNGHTKFYPKKKIVLRTVCKENVFEGFAHYTKRCHGRQDSFYLRKFSAIELRAMPAVS